MGSVASKLGHRLAAPSVNNNLQLRRLHLQRIALACSVKTAFWMLFSASPEPTSKPQRHLVAMRYLGADAPRTETWGYTVANDVLRLSLAKEPPPVLGAVLKLVVAAEAYVPQQLRAEVRLWDGCNVEWIARPRGAMTLSSLGPRGSQEAPAC